MFNLKMNYISNFISKLNTYLKLNRNLCVVEHNNTIYQLCIILKTYFYIKNVCIIKLKQKYFLIIELYTLTETFLHKKFTCIYFNINKTIFVPYKQLNKYNTKPGVYILNTSYGLMSSLKAHALQIGGILFMYIK